MRNVYITSAGKFLPNEPVGNDVIEDYLGRVNGRPSKVKPVILERNGIKTRHYALDRQGNSTHSLSGMAAAAVRDALSGVELPPSEVDLLCAATTQADLLIPGFAAMVHGELPELGPVEILSSISVCCAGMAAFSHAHAQVALGRRRAAVSLGAEFASRYFLASKLEDHAAVKAGEPLSFDIEFLRWMISDGAGAFLVQDRPRPQGISLRVDYVDLISHAHENPVCMYSGLGPDKSQKGWMEYRSYHQAVEDGAFALRQDLQIVDRVIQYMVGDFVKLLEAGHIQRERIDWFLCHYSSHFFRGRVIQLLEQAGQPIAEEKWFTNLYTRGNTGNASIYLMLEELLNSGQLQPGQRIACLVPESGRFTTAYLLLTAVDASSSKELAP